MAPEQARGGGAGAAGRGTFPNFQDFTAVLVAEQAGRLVHRRS